MKKKTLHKVLIIDDDLDILTIAKFSLSIRPDLAVICAKSGEEGIQAAITEQPDLILLDLMMPMMDGFDTLKAIHLIPSIQKIPVIFFTVRRMSSLEFKNYRKLGVPDFILKPFDPISFPHYVEAIWNNATSSGPAK